MKRIRSTRQFLVVLAVIPLLLAAGCGGDSSSSDSKTVAITISPTEAPVIAGQSVTLTVDPKNTAVVWPTKTGNFRNYTQNGNTVIYTPPATPGTYNFTVTAEEDSSKKATAKITVRATGSALDIDRNVHGPIQGNAGAKIVMVDFSDYQCPVCATYVKGTYPELKKQYIDTGKIRYVMLDLPVLDLNKNADNPLSRKSSRAAEASHCADDQGRFWEMHDRMMNDQTAVGTNDLSSYARALKLNVEQFESCLETEQKYREVVKEAASRHEALVKSLFGDVGVPSFLIGIADPDTPQQVQVLWMIRGADTLENFKQKLDAALVVVP